MIQFDTDLATDKHLWVFNNNIIKFYDDEVNVVSEYAEITSDQFSSVIYPDTQGKFTFNFYEHVKALAVKNKLNDLIDFDIQNNIASLVYDDTENVHFSLLVDISIKRVDAVDVEQIKTYNFIAGVEQLEDYQREESPQKNLFLLQNPIAGFKHKYHVNYWKGYPFDLSVYSSTTGDMNLKNVSNGLDVNLPIAPNTVVNRIALCDANSNITINDFLPIANGISQLQIKRPNFNPQVDINETPLEIYINKHQAQCGLYIKFRNAKGGWSYWLFSDNNSKELDVKDLEELDNDFSNIDNTISPTLQGGKKSSTENIKAYAIGLTKNDLRTLEYIVESPKIYLFTGERFSVNNTDTDNKWIGIKCATRKFNRKKSRKHKYNVTLNFEMPKRNIISLL